MKNEFWIARDKPMRGATVGDILIYGHKPIRDEQNGVFCSQLDIDYANMVFFECCDTTDMIVLNPKSFPEVTWENSPQKLTLTNLNQL